MKPTAIVALLVCAATLAIAVRRAHPTEAGADRAPAAAAAADARPAPELFPSVEDLEADPSINPSGRVPSDAERGELEAVRQQYTAALRTVAEARSRAQLDLAERRILAGAAEPYAPGTRISSDEGLAAVVVGTGPGAEPLVVRIRADELPEFSAWRDLRNSLRADARREFVRIFQAGN